MTGELCWPTSWMNATCAITTGKNATNTMCAPLCRCSSAARAMLSFGFRSLHLHRIWANCISENIGSARVLEKIGMKREGELRNHEYFKDRWWNTLMYGILEDEWETNHKGKTEIKVE